MLNNVIVLTIQSAQRVVMDHLQVDLVTYQFSDVFYTILDHCGPVYVCVCAYSYECVVCVYVHGEDLTLLNPA